MPSANALFFNIGSAIFEFVRLGAMQFTLMYGANSAANETVNPSTAAFAEPIMEPGERFKNSSNQYGYHSDDAITFKIGQLETLDNILR